MASQPTRPTPKLYRTLARDLKIRGIIAEDVPWMWAAYKMEAFDALPPDFSQIELRQALSGTFASKSGVVVLTAPHKRGKDTPVGIVMLSVVGQFNDGRSEVQPEFIWFPWGSDRNRLESSLNFFNEMRQGNVVTVTTTSEHQGFMERICKYGVCRRVGTRENYFGADQRGVMFETRSR